MNINIDNYEAYLLDYLDGNLNAEEMAQLKAFVEAQGLDWTELTEEMPQLTAPAVVFENKETLKHKPKVIPMFVKIASAAAAVALLFVLVWKPGSRLRDLEMTAELKPIGAQEVVEEPMLLAESQARFIVPKQTKPVPKQSQDPKVSVSTRASEMVEVPLLAELQPKGVSSLSSQFFPSVLMASDISEPEFMAYQQPDMDDRELSLLRRGFLVMTDGQFDSFGGMLKESWRSVKVELAQLNESVSDGFSTIKQKSF